MNISIPFRDAEMTIKPTERHEINKLATTNLVFLNGLFD